MMFVTWPPPIPVFSTCDRLPLPDHWSALWPLSSSTIISSFPHLTALVKPPPPTVTSRSHWAVCCSEMQSRRNADVIYVGHPSLRALRDTNHLWCWVTVERGWEMFTVTELQRAPALIRGRALSMGSPHVSTQSSSPVVECSTFTHDDCSQRRKRSCFILLQGGCWGLISMHSTVISLHIQKPKISHLA